MKRVLFRSLVIAAAILLGWTLAGVFFITQDLARTMVRDPEMLEEVAVLGATSVVIWMVLTPLILYLGQGLRPRPLLRLVVRVLAIALTFAVIRAAIGALFVPLIEPRPVVWRDFTQALTVQFHGNFTLIVLLLAARGLYDGVRAMREKERRALVLETQLARAQLEHLRFQLQPHFLFNTINSIATLVHTRPARADEMLMDLAALLRSTLDLGRTHTIPLHRELELLDHYLRIQHMRFHDRLQVARRIDAAALACEVPPLLLQPLVENSLRHVVAQRAEGGRVEVEARRAGERLLLRIADDGPGFDPETARLGVGITNTLARLEQLYRGAARIDFTRGDGTFVITIDIPIEAAA